MSLFRLAKKNIQTFATKRLKQFMWISMNTMICFFMISFRFNEVVVSKAGYTPIFVNWFYVLFLFVVFVCTFITYKMTASLLQVRREEFKSYEVVNMTRKEMFCLLCQEQLLTYGGAFVFGLIHGMLFLKLFTIIFMKAVGIQGVTNAPITMYAIVVTAVVMIIVIIISMWQCCRFTQRLKGEKSHETRRKV
ncbi:FtsX-like permease family protein [Bacillus paramycoides]|uniref:ABC transporter permease n=1 Tax=Bacillus paramycoides TaxID=2026194 RepID=A0ABU6MUP7_9BACI|nr:FtsX-like permease family protein [Bacillus paramycoides]MED0978611.1 ABC transporter permease [Bacillus paramycoides]MED1092923.1 ABC transporter permease [Bacillus paramycoides]MED1105235.1 ABC transporter permease [Bacillus paramycoides]MED1566608.1 ABC transporter permease [Bacillus paramycoides]